MPKYYEIWDSKEKRVVSTAKTLKGAIRSSDRRNLEYGAHRYGFRPVY